LNKDNFEKKTELKEAVQKGNNEKIDPTILVDKILHLKNELDNKTYRVAGNQKEEQVRAYRIVTMLGLATGRRFTELMKRGKKITFSGLLKGNDKTIEGNIIALSYADVKKYLKEL